MLTSLFFISAVLGVVIITLGKSQVTKGVAFLGSILVISSWIMCMVLYGAWTILLCIPAEILLMKILQILFLSNKK